MKKRMLIAFAALILILPVSGSHAADIKVVGWPDSVAPDQAGSFEFDVYLLNTGELLDIGAFNVGLRVSGADGLEIPIDSVEGPVDPDYIFAGNSLFFSAGHSTGNPSTVVFGDLTANSIGVELNTSKLLGRMSLVYPAIDPGTLLTVSLIPGENFIRSEDGSLEDLRIVPIPSAIWLMGGGLLALFRIRRLIKGQ